MIKQLHDKVWVFDVEWVPDQYLGSKLLDLEPGLSEKEVFEKMWAKAGADKDNPMPYLKTIQCRVVCICFVTRYVTNGAVKLSLVRLPDNPEDVKSRSEYELLNTFFDAIGKRKPQLVGFNSQKADLKILMQRALGAQVQAKEFCSRPEKPWLGMDYFSTNEDWHVDLMNVLGGYGQSTPSLNELALSCSIPGKIDVSGEQVSLLWLNKEYENIVAYNEFDALTTYLIWLRYIYFTGKISNEQYFAEQQIFEQLLNDEIAKGKDHLVKYLKNYHNLKQERS